MHRQRSVPLQRQRGEFNLPRLLTICAILVAVLMVPLYFLKQKGKAYKARAAAASAPAASPP